jgi:Tfp pilus assembly protein PilP
MKMSHQILFRLGHWLVLPFAVWALAQTSAAAGQTSIPSNPVLQTQSAVSGIPYQSDSRRDPFLVPIQLDSKNNPAKLVDEEAPRGTPPPGIAGMLIDQVTLVGISSQSGSRIAILRGSDKRVYFLRQGDKLFDGYVRQIGADYVSLVRETKMKSGKLITQDLTKRLRTP